MRQLLLEEGESDRNLKLGMTRQWSVGFFDISGAGAFSELLEMQLLSGADYEPFEGAIGYVPSNQSDDEDFNDGWDGQGMDEDFEHPD